jgi:hypothetical protein
VYNALRWNWEEDGPRFEACSTEKVCNVSEPLEQIQQEASVRGQQMKQWPRQQQRAVTDEALTLLADDVAQSLFPSTQHMMNVVAAHKGAGVCKRAFLERYRSQLP